MSGGRGNGRDGLARGGLIVGSREEKQIYETAFIHNEASEWEKCSARVSVHSLLRPRESERQEGKR